MHIRHGDRGAPRPGLLPVEQCGDAALLRVRFLQGRRAGRCSERLAQAFCTQCRHARRTDWDLLHRLLCFSEYPTGRNRLPVWSEPDDQSPTQMGLLLVIYLINSLELYDFMNSSFWSKQMRKSSSRIIWVSVKIMWKCQFLEHHASQKPRWSNLKEEQKKKKKVKVVWKWGVDHYTVQICDLF